jgi:hypothetical protein
MSHQGFNIDNTVLERWLVLIGRKAVEIEYCYKKNMKGDGHVNGLSSSLDWIKVPHQNDSEPHRLLRELLN